MRILHTSDWHLGRLFHKRSLLADQEKVVDRLVDLVRVEGIDVVLIAGDLYDRAIPPVDAVELFDEALARLREVTSAVVAITGNHDSATRAAFGDRVLARAGVVVRGDLRRAGEAVEVATDDGGPPVFVHPVPYLEPIAVSHLIDGDAVGTAADAPEGPDPEVEGEVEVVRRLSGRRLSHHEAMAWAIGRCERTDGARHVLVAHAFVTGAESCDSERALSMGGADNVGLGLFEGFDYVALGHLHGQQRFADGRVTYAGSPLAYSFSEERHRKGVRVVELTADGKRTEELVELGVGRPVRTIRGRLDELLTATRFAEAEHAWVRAEVTDADLPLQVMARLQQRFPHAVELVRPARPASGPGRPSSTAVRRRQPLELAEAFVADQRGTELDDLERTILMDAFDATTGAAATGVAVA